MPVSSQSFLLNLSAFSLHAALHLLLSPDATCSHSSASLPLPSLLCSLFHVLFMHHSSYCLAEHQPLLCPFMLSPLSQSQFFSSTPLNVVFLIVLTASQIRIPLFVLLIFFAFLWSTCWSSSAPCHPQTLQTDDPHPLQV